MNINKLNDKLKKYENFFYQKVLENKKINKIEKYLITKYPGGI